MRDHRPRQVWTLSAVQSLDRGNRHSLLELREVSQASTTVTTQRRKYKYVAYVKEMPN